MRIAFFSGGRFLSFAIFAFEKGKEKGGIALTVPKRGGRPVTGGEGGERREKG